MIGSGIERRLAAILMADVVGYSRLMGQDEAATLLALQESRFAVTDPTIGSHHGRIIKLMGDGILAEFGSAVEAVACAIEIQRRMIERNRGVPEDRQIRFRVGVNIVEVLHDDDDVYGDGVNVASRLQELAETNGVAISRAVFVHVEDEIDERFADLGAHQLKNIAKPVRVFHFSPTARADGGHAKAAFRPFIDMPEAQQAFAGGGCLCGAVRYEIHGKPLGSMLCQCRMCQRFSGAPILGGTTMLAEALVFTQGAPKFFQSSKIAKRGFCADCGTALLYQGLVGIWTKWVMVFTASLDAPQDFPPTYNLGVESAMPWLGLHDDLPRTQCKDSPSLIDAYRAVGQEVP
ncbi:MAG: adenylate/guanylate cyclase domain-containing protein [Pseudomonadota bacterium]